VEVMAKVIEAKFNGGIFACTEPSWKWDYGDRLVFSDIELPSSYEVHFANKTVGTSVTVLGDEDGVVIPAQFFVPGSVIYAWIFLVDGENGYTKYQVVMPILDRAQPSNEQPTPAQQSALDDAVARLNEAEQGIPTAIDTALAEAKASGEFDGPQGPEGPQGATGPSGRAGNNIWHTTVEPTNYSGHVAFRRTELTGRSVAPLTGDTIIQKSKYIYYVDSLSGTTWVYVSYGGSIKGDTGPAGQDGVDGVGVPTGGTTGQVLKKASNTDYDTEWADESGGSGGTSDYTALSNKPQINGHTLSGNQSASDLGLSPAGAYVKPIGGIPKADLASGVQTSLGLADSAYQKPSGGIPATDLASGVIPSVPSASSATPQALGTAAAGTSTDYSRADHVHAKPTYSKSDVGLGNVDNVQQYSATNPPPYPVTSVNGQTGAVTLSIPSAAADVGAVAVSQGVGHAGEFLVVGNDGNVTTVTMSVWQGGNYGS
jgi:hypothetical protein